MFYTYCTCKNWKPRVSSRYIHPNPSTTENLTFQEGQWHAWTQLGLKPGGWGIGHKSVAARPTKPNDIQGSVSFTGKPLIILQITCPVTQYMINVFEGGTALGLERVQCWMRTQLALHWCQQASVSAMNSKFTSKASKRTRDSTVAGCRLSRDWS